MTESALAQRCRETLAGGLDRRERDGVAFAYTRPSPERYPWQWYWDSCFAAIAWRHFDPARSRAELETLLAAARPDGFIGHTIFWERPGPLAARALLQRDRPRRRDDLDDPAAGARVRLADRGRRPALEPRIVAHHAAISAQRDLEGDGLLWILQPDESGLDASPQFDPIWRTRAQGLPGFIELVHRNRRARLSHRRVVADGDPVVCEVLTNVLHGLSRLALGLPSITPALIARLYDEPSGLFLPAVEPADRRAVSRSPGRRSRRSRCPICRRRSAAALSATCSTSGASGRRSRRPPSRSTSRASRCASTWAACAATGAARPGSTAPG